MTRFLALYTLWLPQLFRRQWPGSSWQYASQKRDLRLDFLRGFAVCAMLINHIGGEPSWFYAITGGNRFFVSVAELFVAISGLLVGSIYASIIVRQGLGAALLKCLQRAWKLYLLTVVLTLGFAGLTLVLGLGWAPELTAETWPEFILSVMTLHRTFHMTDILLLYTLLLLAAVPVLLLLAYGYTIQVLAGTWALWALWQLAPQHAQFPWPIAHTTVFHFPAWQVLFMNALVIGYHRQDLTQRLSRLSLQRVFYLTGLLVAGAIVCYIWEPWSPELTEPVARLFEKPNLGPARLLAFVSFFSFAWALLTLAWQPLSRALSWLFLPLGQQALLAYTLHLVLLALALKVQPAWHGIEGPSVWHNMLIQATAVGCLWGLITLKPAVVAAFRQGMPGQPQRPTAKRLSVYTPGARVAALALAITCFWL